MTILGKASSVRQLSWIILVGIAGVLVLWLLVPQRLAKYI